VAVCTTTTVGAVTCRSGRVAAVAVADRVVVGVVAASAAAVSAVVVAPRAVASASGGQTVAAIGLLSKGCRRQCPESRVRVRPLASGRVRARRLAIGRVAQAARVRRSVTGRVALVVRVRRLAIVVRARVAQAALRWGIVARVQAARHR